MVAPWSTGCETKIGIARALAAHRRENYLAVRKAHRDAKHAGKVGECRQCRGELLKLDAL